MLVLAGNDLRELCLYMGNQKTLQLYACMLCSFILICNINGHNCLLSLLEKSYLREQSVYVNLGFANYASKFLSSLLTI